MKLEERADKENKKMSNNSEVDYTIDFKVKLFKIF